MKKENDVCSHSLTFLFFVSWCCCFDKIECESKKWENLKEVEGTKCAEWEWPPKIPGCDREVVVKTLKKRMKGTNTFWTGDTLCDYTWHFNVRLILLNVRHVVCILSMLLCLFSWRSWQPVRQSSTTRDTHNTTTRLKWLTFETLYWQWFLFRSIGRRSTLREKNKGNAHEEGDIDQEKRKVSDSRKSETQVQLNVE